MNLKNSITNQENKYETIPIIRNELVDAKGISL
ncbi:hypothetical protein Belba_3251 [Belliella baltica DSM 15883]|uniref:Uncharacterized protein n=1 Tax=Belliella baltica (strain DSM 15883 / CIP 108006 / LMG 21964 / BA134) TaxID=866536 RepID=I3Z943_BELBD|nr:hypothetical protein Belba_3251 [Belliella baltica DSM 15883]